MTRTEFERVTRTDSVVLAPRGGTSESGELLKPVCDNVSDVTAGVTGPTDFLKQLLLLVAIFSISLGASLPDRALGQEPALPIADKAIGLGAVEVKFPGTTTEARRQLRIPADIPILTGAREIEVPIFIRHQGDVSEVLFGIDYDELLIELYDISIEGESIATSVVRDNHDSGRGIYVVQLTVDSSIGTEGESLLASLRFGFNPFSLVGHNDTDGSSSTLQSPIRFLREESHFLLAQRDVVGEEEVQEEGAARNAQNVLIEISPELLDGRLTVYVGDIVELGSARMTPELHTFTIPVYVTHIERSFDLLSMGIDYDELFLTLICVTSPGEVCNSASRPLLDIDWEGKTVLDDGSSRPGTITVSFGRKGFSEMLRTHVLDLHFELVPADDLPDQLGIELLLPPDLGGGADRFDHDPRVDFRSGQLEFVEHPFIRGDVDASGNVVVSDALLLLNSVYRGLGEVKCQEAADVSDNGKVDITDAVSLLNFLFNGGEAPPAPFPDIGFDPAIGRAQSSSLGCSNGPFYFELIPPFGRQR